MDFSEPHQHRMNKTSSRSVHQFTFKTCHSKAKFVNELNIRIFIILYCLTVNAASAGRQRRKNANKNIVINGTCASPSELSMNGIITVFEYSSLQSLPTHYQLNDLHNIRGENETTRLNNLIYRLCFQTEEIFGFIVTVTCLCSIQDGEKERNQLKTLLDQSICGAPLRSTLWGGCSFRGLDEMAAPLLRAGGIGWYLFLNALLFWKVGSGRKSQWTGLLLRSVPEERGFGYERRIGHLGQM